MAGPVRLGVNIDHVATVRNARGGSHPDPVRAAREALAAGADGITAHLREDRRHITDSDIAALSELCAEAGRPLNLEMAVTEEMLAIALRHRPHAACLVPERREEVTTEGGLAVSGHEARIQPVVKALADAGMRVSLFIEPSKVQVAINGGCWRKQPITDMKDCDDDAYVYRGACYVPTYAPPPRTTSSPTQRADGG